MRFGVLISGSGTNLQSIIDACAAGLVPGAVEIVISNREDAYGLVRAKMAGIPALFVDPGAYASAATTTMPCAWRSNSRRSSAS